MPFALVPAAAALLLAVPSVWLDVPYVRQLEEGCGAASVAMVMQYWTHQDSQIDPAAAAAERIYRELATAPGKGSSGKALQQYLERNGFRAFIFNGEIADLRHHLDKGRPTIVCLAPRGPRAQLHYVVVVGLSEAGVLVHDPVRGKLMHDDLKRFEREWKATGHWSLLAVPGPAK